jgi:hypothetical protein
MSISFYERSRVGVWRYFVLSICTSFVGQDAGRVVENTIIASLPPGTDPRPSSTEAKSRFVSLTKKNKLIGSKIQMMGFYNLQNTQSKPLVAMGWMSVCHITEVEN